MPIHDWTRVDSGIFHHFHQRWIGALCDVFNTGGLPPGYFALAEQIASGPIPDVLALQQLPKPAPPPDAAGGMAVLTAPPQTRYVFRAEPEGYARKANRVAIRHNAGRVVSVIEIVSPGNKDSRNALRAFVEKAVDLIRQGIHLLVVDLFPPGPRDPHGIHKAIWDEIHEEPFELPPDKPLTLAAYTAGPVKGAHVEPVAVGDVLPPMPLFLEPENCILTPLEATYQTTWGVFPAALKGTLEAPA
jgi:uncharacterized protein DUF4058